MVGADSAPSVTSALAPASSVASAGLTAGVVPNGEVSLAAGLSAVGASRVSLRATVGVSAIVGVAGINVAVHVGVTAVGVEVGSVGVGVAVAATT